MEAFALEERHASCLASTNTVSYPAAVAKPLLAPSKRALFGWRQGRHVVRRHVGSHRATIPDRKPATKPSKPTPASPEFAQCLPHGHGRLGCGDKTPETCGCAALAHGVLLGNEDPRCQSRWVAVAFLCH